MFFVALTEQKSKFYTRPCNLRLPGDQNKTIMTFLKALLDTMVAL